MAQTIVQAVSGSVTSNSSTTGVSKAWDSTPVDGNSLWVGISARGNQNTGAGITPPGGAGWTQVDITNNGSNNTVAVFWKIAASEGATTGAFTTNTNVHTTLVACEVSGSHATTPKAASGISTGSTNPANVTVSGLTSGTDYLLLYFGSRATNTTATPDADHSELEDLNTTGGSNVSGYLSYDVSRTGSTSYTDGCTWASSGNWAALMVAVEPAAAPSQTMIPGGALARAVSGFTLMTAGTAPLIPGGALARGVAGSTIMAAGSVTAAPGGVLSGGQAGRVTMETVQAAIPGGVQAGSQAGSTVLTPGTATIIPGGVTSGTQAGFTFMNAGSVTIAPGGVSSGGRVGKISASLAGLVIGAGGAVARAVAGATPMTGTGTVSISPGGVSAGAVAGAIVIAFIVAARRAYSRAGGRGIIERAGARLPFVWPGSRGNGPRSGSN